MVRPAIDETIAATTRALRTAGLQPSDLRAIVLVGGSSRIPLVAQLVTSCTRATCRRRHRPEACDRSRRRSPRAPHRDRPRRASPRPADRRPKGFGGAAASAARRRPATGMSRSRHRPHAATGAPADLVDRPTAVEWAHPDSASARDPGSVDPAAGVLYTAALVPPTSDPTNRAVPPLPGSPSASARVLIGAAARGDRARGRRHRAFGGGGGGDGESSSDTTIATDDLECRHDVVGRSGGVSAPLEAGLLSALDFEATTGTVTLQGEAAFPGDVLCDAEV